MAHLDIINRVLGNWKYKDRAAFYCPYMPLTMAGAMVPSTTTSVANTPFTVPMTFRYVYEPPKTICAIEGRSHQGGWFDAVAVLSFRGQFTRPEIAIAPIVEWCAAQWGEEGPEPAVWRRDDTILYLRDDRLLVELTMRWQGVEF